MSSLVIDCLGQLGTGETWPESGPPRWVDYKVEGLLARAADAGIDRTCVMAPQNVNYAEKNREIANACEKYPDKLFGFAVHSPQREAGKLRQLLTEEVRSMGLKAVKSDGHPTRELLDVAAELKIPIVYYPASQNQVHATAERDERAYLNLTDRCIDPPSVSFHMMATLYPTVNFILPHLGTYRTATWWAHIDAINLAKRFSNVYLETSGVLSHKYLEMAAQELSAEKLLFGSYSPETDARVEVYAIKLLKYSEADEERVMGGNIGRLLR